MRALSLFHQRWTNQHDWGAASTVKTAVSLEPRVLECYKLHRDLQPRLPKLLKWDNRETHFTINQRLIYFNGRATKWETTLQKKKHILVLPEHLEPISVPVQPHVMRWEEAVDITCPLTGTVRLNSVEFGWIRLKGLRPVGLCVGGMGVGVWEHPPQIVLIMATPCIFFLQFETKTEGLQAVALQGYHSFQHLW